MLSVLFAPQALICPIPNAVSLVVQLSSVLYSVLFVLWFSLDFVL